MISSQSVSAEKIKLQNATLTLIKKCTFSFRLRNSRFVFFGSFVRLIKYPVHCCDRDCMRRRKRILFLYVLFLCVAYINKSIYIYIYELAVEFCIFESSIII